MAMGLRQLIFTPDGDTGAQAFTLLPDTRDLYRLREMAEKQGWPEDMNRDAIRQTYALGWIAARRLGLLEPPDLHFADFVDRYAMDTPEPVEVDPTNPAP
jgi:hypothetical protein